MVKLLLMENANFLVLTLCDLARRPQAGIPYLAGFLTAPLSSYRLRRQCERHASGAVRYLQNPCMRMGDHRDRVVLHPLAVAMAWWYRS